MCIVCIVCIVCAVCAVCVACVVCCELRVVRVSVAWSVLDIWSGLVGLSWFGHVVCCSCVCVSWWVTWLGDAVRGGLVFFCHPGTRGSVALWRSQPEDHTARG